jgi:hypothetical protein
MNENDWYERLLRLLSEASASLQETQNALIEAARSVASTYEDTGLDDDVYDGSYATAQLLNDEY